jgi:hypothetical protein
MAIIRESFGLIFTIPAGTRCFFLVTRFFVLSVATYLKFRLADFRELEESLA